VPERPASRVAGLRTRAAPIGRAAYGSVRGSVLSVGDAHAHHIAFRSQGGGDEPENQVGLCPFHHLRCVHGGYLRVFGRAPDALVWFRGGKVWRGPGAEVRGDASHAAFAS
jgi:hypothetical protein